MAAFESAELPTGQEELWRYSRIAELQLGRFAPVTAARARAIPPIPRAAQGLLDRIGDRGGLVITYDGVIVEASLGEAALSHGIHLSSAATHQDAEQLVGSVSAHFAERGDRDALDWLADAFVGEVTVLTVPRSVELAEPIVLVHVIGPPSGAPATSDEPAALCAVFPRTLVHLAENAGASVVEILVSGDTEMLVAPTTELSISDGARLTHHYVQQLGTGSWHLGRLFARAGRDATLKSFQASLGGSYARSRTDSVLTGQGGTAQLLAAFLGDGNQMHDFRTLQEHSAPRTTSDLVFKGAVGGTSRSVYSGMIHMRHGARGANAFQTNRNLVLSDGAHADSVPNLDIEENDVRCSHASAVGPIEEEQRFYLESRGVPREAAERLILLGFFGELLERVMPAVGDHIVASIRDRVAAITGAAL